MEREICKYKFIYTCLYRKFTFKVNLIFKVAYIYNRERPRSVDPNPFGRLEKDSDPHCGASLYYKCKQL